MKKIDNKNGHKGTIYILLRLRVSIVAMRSLSATLWNNLAIGLCGRAHISSVIRGRVHIPNFVEVC